MRIRTATTFLLLVLLVFAAADSARAQLSDEEVQHAAWTPLYEAKGVDFSFIFYREGDNEHNGVVVRLLNTNPYPASVRFRMVFRSDTSEHVAAPYERRLAGGEMVTGSSDGLWWIPFRDEQTIREVGMRGMRVRTHPPVETGPP